MTKKNNKRTAHIISHTHWDREWRYPIWQTRLMLLNFIDELIELLESGGYESFLLDGQVMPLLDYLELRPEMTDRIKKLVAEGKLEIGPWFTLPDEYPVDGESLVRNLLWGHRESGNLGKVLRVGYTPFGWGQTAQLPQIYRGFGIDIAMIGKKVSKTRAPKCEFLWRGPDGSEMLSTRFGNWGRSNFYFKIHLTSLFGKHYEGLEWAYDCRDRGTLYHHADSEHMEQDHFLLNPPDRWCPHVITKQLIEETWDTTKESVLENDRLMMNGSDYAAAQPLLTEMIEKLNHIDGDNDRQWVQTTTRDFVELMKEKIDVSQLPLVEGELRDGPACDVTGNALTTRLYLKRLNKKAENMLIRFVEPLSVVASTYGVEFPRKMIANAWRYLLQAHPHDSINGVVQDKTALDVENRLLQVLDISEALGDRALQELVRRIDLSDYNDEDVLVAVFNPLPYSRREIVEAYLTMPNNLPPSPMWTIDEREWVQLYDPHGEPVPSQCMGYTKVKYPVTELHTRAFPYYGLRFRVFFETGEIPACGYKVFKAVMKTNEIGRGKCWGNHMARTGTLLKSPDIMENEFLKVKMNGDGTFNILDKELKREFRDLNYYEDRGEIGDYWVNKGPLNDKIYSTRGCKAKKWCCQQGPLQASLVSEVQMDIPSHAVLEQQARADEITPLLIQTQITLKKGQRHVEVKVSFENRHHNHYLRAMFPTGLVHAEYADSGGHFCVDHRPIHPLGPTENSIWPDMASLPHNMFVDISDGTTGFAFVNEGLTEYEILEDEERTLALSLLRSTRNWICTELRVGSDFPSQKGGQCLGRHSIRYALMPHKGNWQTANIPLVAEKFNVPLQPVRTNSHPGIFPATQKSFLEIGNPILRFSALKKSEDRDTFIVRLYNPTDEIQKGSLKFNVPLVNAWLTNLNEEREKEIVLNEKNSVPLIVDHHKIVSIEIESAKIGIT